MDMIVPCEDFYDTLKPSIVGGYEGDGTRRSVSVDP